MGFIVADGVLVRYVRDNSGTSVVIPDGVTCIGNDAFSFCSSATSITIPNSVLKIGRRAFRGCEALTNITLSDSVKSIADRAFWGCKSLASIAIPNGVRTIEDDTFFGCSSLTSVSIPDSVISIGNHAFDNCRSLANVEIPDGTTRIGDGAFAYCGSLNSITIPDSVTSIGEGAFLHCEFVTIFTKMSDAVNINRWLGGDYVSDIALVSPNNKIESFEDKKFAIRGYLLHPEMFSGDIAEGYRAYFVKTSWNYLSYIFRHDLVPALSILAEVGKIMAGNYEEKYLAPALKAGAEGCVAFILDWVNKNISQEEKDREFERHFERAFSSFD